MPSSDNSVTKRIAANALSYKNFEKYSVRAFKYIPIGCFGKFLSSLMSKNTTTRLTTKAIAGDQF